MLRETTKRHAAERILLLAVDPAVRRRARRLLADHGYGVAAHESPGLAMEALHAEDFDVVAVSPSMLADPAELARRLAAERPDLPVVTLSGDPERDTRAVDRALRVARRRPRLRRLEPPEGASFDELVGSSPAMVELRALLTRILAIDAPILLVGETGTGKEMVARALHERGPRRDHPFVAVNCAAIPEGLLEAELFGHERGAFTSAVDTRFGLIATANRGTLLLDEIQALPLHLQPKLLKVLEDRAIRPLGSGREVPFECRIVCASNVDLHAEADAGRFRDDLLFRIDVLQIELPPLRARDGDILELAERFLADIAERRAEPPCHLAPAAAEALLEHRWPGNVRELMHAMEAASALAAGGAIEVTDLPEDVRTGGGPQRIRGGPITLAELRRWHARAVLEAVGGNKKRAAEVLDIPRQRLYRLLAK